MKIEEDIPIRIKTAAQLLQEGWRYDYETGQLRFKLSTGGSFILVRSMLKVLGKTITKANYRKISDTVFIDVDETEFQNESINAFYFPISVVQLGSDFDILIQQINQELTINK